MLILESGKVIDPLEKVRSTDRVLGLLAMGACFAADITVGPSFESRIITKHIENGGTGSLGELRVIETNENSTEVLGEGVSVPLASYRYYHLDHEHPTVEHLGSSVTHVAE